MSAVTTAPTPTVDDQATAALGQWLALRLAEGHRRALARFVCDMRRCSGGILVVTGHPGAGHSLITPMIRRHAPPRMQRHALSRTVAVSGVDASGGPSAARHTHEARVVAMGSHADRSLVVGAALAASLAGGSDEGTREIASLMPNPDAGRVLVVSYEGLGWHERTADSDTQTTGITVVHLCGHARRGRDGRAIDGTLELRARGGDLARWAREHTGG